jgi:RNA polymerase sigma factor (sigma-70 family)
MTAADRDTMITDHLKVVRQEAARASRRAPRFVEYDDLYGAGVMGLVQSADRWRPDTNVPFTAFARCRVRGAILDYMRGEDTATRCERRRAREHDIKVPRALFSLETWMELEGGDAPDPPESRPDVAYEARDRERRFRAVLRATPLAKHRLVLFLLCTHSAERVAEITGYNPSRVSQLKSEARERAIAMGLV